MYIYMYICMRIPQYRKARKILKLKAGTPQDRKTNEAHRLDSLSHRGHAVVQSICVCHNMRS